jgi:hypothetical protein
MLSAPLASGAIWFLTFAILGIAAVTAMLTLDVLKVNGFWKKKTNKK